MNSTKVMIVTNSLFFDGPSRLTSGAQPFQRVLKLQMYPQDQRPCVQTFLIETAFKSNTSLNKHSTMHPDLFIIDLTPKLDVFFFLIKPDLSACV